MGSSKMMRIMLVIGNLICFILAILILCISIGKWHEYVGGSFTLLIAIFGLIVACVYSPVVIMGYAVLVALDLLVMVGNGIVLVIIIVQHGKYCFDYDNGAFGPTFGCHDWRNEGHKQRAIGVMVCLFIGVVARVVNFASSMLLARIIYNGSESDGEGIGDRKRTHY